MRALARLTTLSAFLLVITAALSIAARTRNAAGAAWPTRGWPRGTPASVGLDDRALAAFDADLARGRYTLVDSFQVFRCGTEVFTRKYPHDYARIYAKQAKTKGPLNARLTGRYNYFDPAWHPYFHGTDLHTMQSVSKTVTSVILGVAIARGDFKAGLDTPCFTTSTQPRSRTSTTASGA